MENLRLHRFAFFQAWLPWLVLFLLGFLTLSGFVFFPYAGFDISYDKVVSVYSPDPPGDNLAIGDQIIQVGSLNWDDFLKHRWQPVFSGIQPGDIVPMRVERDGRVIDITWIYTGVTSQQIYWQMTGLWWLGFVFWLAGTSTLLFLRPQDTIWKLLIAFYYLTAVWLLAGSGSSRWHVLGAAVILRVAAWMFAPVSLHLNWLFPRPLTRSPAWVWWLLYLLAGALAVLELFSILPEKAYLLGLAIGGIGIILLLMTHVIFQPAYRKYITPLAVGAAIAVAPPLLVLLRDLFSLPFSPNSPEVTVNPGPTTFIYSASMLGIAALPGIYFYSVYILQLGGSNRRIRRLVRLYLLFILVSALLVLFFGFFFVWIDLGLSPSAITILLFSLALVISVIGMFPLLALPATQSIVTDGLPGDHPQLRANRLVSLYLFFVLTLAIVGLLVFLLSTSENLPFTAGWITLAISVLAAMFTIFAFPRFQKFVDRRILGIPLPPTQLLETYSSRITTSLDLSSLVSLLRDELLPSLLVRQSALYQVSNSRLFLLYSTGLGESQLLSGQDLPDLLQSVEALQSGGLVSTGACLPAWVRVIFPLRLETHLVGVWLLGKRDPDDSYEQGEKGVLQAIANQTAIALVNIQQSDRLHALYQADMERQEAERAELALFLHDAVLNPLAALSILVGPDADLSKFEQGIQDLITNLREAVGSLRPAMLNYGLYTALVELVDELSERAPHGVQVRLEMESASLRYEVKVEQHLYRIVEQACENALRHASCRQLLVSGQLHPDRVEISVSDDGVGLPQGLALNLSYLLAEGHYGLVGMYERAALVGAELLIDSSPGAGTTLRLVWRSANFPALKEPP